MERFWDKVALTSEARDCWLWTGSKNRDGYGTFGHPSGKTVLAHRMAWELEHFKIGDGLYVLHRCDNPACVNPNHLFLGTQADNVADCARKGRRNQVRYKKLTPEQREELWALYMSGEFTQQELAERFGVSQPNVSHHIRARASS